MNITHRIRRVALVALVAASSLAGTAADVSAAQPSVNPAPTSSCTPSPFHFHVYRYKNLQAIGQYTVSPGNAISNVVYNHTGSAVSMTVSYSKSASVTATASASVEVGISDLVSSAKAQTGISVGTSFTWSASQSYTIKVPNKYYGWAQRKVIKVKFSGTVVSVDAICNVVDYTGPITLVAPRTYKVDALYTSTTPPN